MTFRYSYTCSLLCAILFPLAFSLSVSAQDTQTCTNEEDYTIVDIDVKCLPPLNIARIGHATLCLNGELVVFGGHGPGFVPLDTAEYLCDGKWNVVPMAYPHDHGTIFTLRSGKVFLSGGHKEPLGIGHLFSAEIYDPATHSFRGFGCLDEKRAFANAIEMSDGQVIIAGNWYADDEIEMFENVYDPYLTNTVKVKDVSFPRAKPYMLRISDDDAIIFGSRNNKWEPTDCSVIDRLKGPAYHEPFLEAWHPLSVITIPRSSNLFIGNEEDSIYEWLLPVANVESGRVAIARVKGNDAENGCPEFSLLPTLHPVPDSIRQKRICYSNLICDIERGLAYLIGDDDEAYIYVIAIDYASEHPSPLTIYVTGPQPISAQSTTPALTPEGNLVFAGGSLFSNFSPSNTVILLPIGQYSSAQSAATNNSKTYLGMRALWWCIIILCLLACAISAILISRRKRDLSELTPAPHPQESAPNQDTQAEKNLSKEEILADLFKRIKTLMKDEQLYLNSNLKVSDIATLVNSNTAYVSAAINKHCECSFSQFLASYRISFAQSLMRQNPDSKISTISSLSGFSNDTTFFRAFRSITGMSPKEWLSEINENKQQ